MGFERWAGQSAYRVARTIAARREGDVPPYGSLDLAVFGLGRSGTSLLMAMLNAHPEVSIVPDTRVMRTLTARFPRAFARTLTRTRLRQSASLNAYEIFERVIERRVPERTRLVGEKTPTHIENALVMGALWRDMRFVEIRRDPRAVLASRRRAAWSSSRTLTRHLVAMRTHWHLGRIAEEVLGDRYHVVSYEALLKDPESELRTLCEFLDIRPTSEMLHFHESAASLIRKEESQWKNRIVTPLDPSRARAGDNELGPHDAAAVSWTFALDRSQDVGRRVRFLAFLARVLSRVSSILVLALSVALILPVFNEGSVEELELA